MTNDDSSRIHELLHTKVDLVLRAGESHSFASEQAKRCVLKDIKVTGVKLDETGDDTTAGRGSTAQTIIEFEVDDSCCNIAGNAHGGFLTWLVDHCSSTPIFCLQSNGRWTTSGVSTNINTFYIGAAPSGTKLRIISNVLQIGRTTATVDVRVEDCESGRLIVQAMHVKQDVAGHPETQAKLGGYKLLEGGKSKL